MTQLREDEILNGVSLKDERLRRLVDFAAERRGAYAAAMQRLEDLLPLVELAATGLPVALILAGPARRWINSL